MKTETYSSQTLFSLFVMMAVSGLSTQAASYPDTPTFGPADFQFSSGFSEFNPVWIDSDMSIHSEAPQIAEWIRYNEPGDTMALTGEDFTAFANEGEKGRDTRFVLYGEGWPEADGHILLLDKQHCAVMLPEGKLPADEIYLMWPHNEHGFGEPVRINGTELWWMDGSVATGATFRIYGQNLTLGDHDSYVFIDGVNVLLTNTVNNPYMSEYKLPASVPSGTYTLWAHNGKGRKYGWSKPLTLEVWNGMQFSPNLSTWYNVTDHGLVGDGQTDNRNALESLWLTVRNDPWPTIYFPAGEYLIGGTSSLIITGGSSSGVRFIGDGLASVIICKTVGNYTESIRWNKDNSVFKDLVIEKADTGISEFSRAIWLYVCNNLRFDNVRFTAVDVSGTEDNRAFLHSVSVSDVTFTNCDFYMDDHMSLEGSGYTFDSCDFKGVHDCGGYGVGSISKLALINSKSDSYDNSDSSNGEKWGKGRWFVSGINHAAANWYIGGNINTNAQPRKPSPALYARPTKIDAPISLDANFYTQRIHFANLSMLDAKIVVMEMPYAPGSVWRYVVLDFDKADNYCTVKYEKVYYDDNWTRALTPDKTNLVMGLINHNDWNAGEQFMKEGGLSVYRGIVSSTTSNTTTFPNLSSYLTEAKKGMSAVIVNGRGLGQSRFVTDITGEKITLADNWRVEPDNTSVIVLGRYATQWAVYDNYLHSDLSAYTNVTCASGGLQFSAGGGAHTIIMDSNTLDGQRAGVVFEISATDAFSAATNTVSPWYFGRISNNVFKDTKRGIFDRPKDDIWTTVDKEVYDDALFIGAIIRKNLFTGTKEHVFVDDTDDIHQSYLMVWDSNTMTNFAKLNHADYRRDNEVWEGNIFYDDGDDVGLALFASEGKDIILHDNVYNNFASNYHGSLPGPDLEVPIRWVDMDGVRTSQTIPILQVGTSPLDWSVSEDSSWLEITSPTNGTVLDENIEGAVTLSLRTIPNEASEAIVTISGAGESQQITVVYTGASTSVRAASIYPISGVEGKIVRIEVRDADDALLKVFETWNPQTITIEELPDGWENIRIIECDKETGTTNILHKQWRGNK